MARALTAVKEAAKNHKGRVLSFNFGNAVDGVWKPLSYPIDQLIEHRAWMESRLRAVTDSLENLLPVEGGMRSNLENQQDGLGKLLTALKPRAHRYPIMSVEPLTWRYEDGYPKLVLMAIDQPGEMEISGSYNPSASRQGWAYLPLGKETSYREVVDRIITPCYEDVIELLQKKAKESLSIRGSATVSIKMSLGSLLIPPKTRAKIAKARQHFGNQIFLIAEAKEWVEDTVVKPDPDPLVVGYEDGLLFLIDVFDLTTIERLATEFATPQP